jgi:hypothetical protein
MLNWINNYLLVKGKAPLVDEFLAAGITACVPEPAESSREWREEHWGSRLVENDEPPTTIAECEGVKTVKETLTR